VRSVVIQASLCEPGSCPGTDKRFSVCLYAKTDSVLCPSPTPWSGFWGTVSMAVERPESEAKLFRESSVEVKNYWSYVTTPQ